MIRSDDSAPLMNLAGSWRYRADAAGTLAYDTACAELFGAGAPEMPVPSQWSRVAPELLHHHGVVWFARTIETTSPSGDDRALIEFDGVDYAVRAWVNDRELGSHTGYFEAFRFDATSALVDGTNRVVVRVDAPRDPGFPERKALLKGIFIHHDCRPGSNHPRFDQSEPTGGIWGGVRLRRTGPVTIENVMIRTDPADGAALVIARAELKNRSDRARDIAMHLEIEGATFAIDPIGAITSASLPPGATVDVALSAVVQNPRLWWTWTKGRPDLYDARVSVTEEGSPRPLDERAERFGIRTIAFDLATLTMSLNGRKIFHRGSNYIPTQWLSTYSEDDYRRDIALMKEANLNAIRVHAHALPRIFYRLADEAGIMVWADFTLIWSYDASEEFAAEALRQYHAFIRERFNHPSIWLWCAHNEGSANDALNVRLEALGRALDPTRVNLKNSGKWPPGPGGWNDHEYSGWYGGSYLDFFHKSHGFVTEYGAQAMPAAPKEFLRGGSQWPPDLDDWEYHDFQVTQNENQLGPLMLYKNLADFVEASQQYQYDVVRFATEAYRRKKYAPTTGLYHFMFTECWPAITWAVADHRRERKMGFHALRDAMAPVIVSIATDRRQLAIGEEHCFGIWVVSDLREPLAGWALRYDAGRGWESAPVSVEADAAREIVSKTISGKKEGSVRVLAELVDPAGRVVSETEWEFIICGEGGVAGRTLLDLANTSWRFRDGADDAARLEETNDRGWESIAVPSRRNGGGPIGWYRARFELPASIDPSKPCVLEMGAVDEADETHVNERFIGKTGEFPPAVAGGATSQTRRRYMIPARTLRPGSNLLTVRVHHPTGQGGIWKEPVRIVPVDESFRYRPVRRRYPELSR